MSSNNAALAGEPPGDIVQPDDLMLVTGAAGFIGTRVVERLLQRGWRNLRCLVRPSSAAEALQAVVAQGRDRAQVEVIKGNLLHPEDCLRAAKGAAVIYHLAAGRGEKSFPEAFMNSVVTTRNLLEAARRAGCLRRFVNVSSFTVYSNRQKPRVLDESCPVERHPELRAEAYCFAKVKQDELVAEYGQRFGIRYVIVRPGYVYGPGNEAITARVGLGRFGLFLHLGGSNPLPLTYVDNCAEAIVLAGLKRGVDGEVFNVVDDEPFTSKQFLRLYKSQVKPFRSIYLPHWASYALCYLWEKYSEWSEGQLPPVSNRHVWHAYWKKTRYTNHKLKSRLGWTPTVSPAEALRRYFESCRQKERYA